MVGVTAKGEATRRRLLDAATQEFSTFGIAGARVDRIAATAGSNKAQLYGYFGHKDDLFDAVYAEHIDRLIATVPLDGARLDDYAAELYDAYLTEPSLVRLSTWARLERHPVGDLYGDGIDHDAGKLEAVATAQAAGSLVADIGPREILQLVTALSLTWSPASPQVAAGPDESESTHRRRKDALRTTVRRAFLRGFSDETTDASS